MSHFRMICDSRRPAFGFEHLDNIAGGMIAEKLAQCFLVVRDAMLLDQSDEVRRRVPRQRGFREVRIGGDEILRAAIQVCEIAAASAGDENFLAGAIGPLQDRDAPAALAGLDRAHQSRSAGAQNQGIEFVKDGGQ